ncbi:MAG: hypothetical protein UR99_C0059G0008 [Candidatus Moranbacteria bacterium GW2011_GWD2_36_12]|nr:MAG: hypothetical protein UR99_C0059G0008 [Candidatus Moranbacteria bacterium GW2011_GWD2_36_12]
MRGSYSGSTGLSKSSGVGSIPAPRANKIKKNYVICYVILFYFVTIFQYIVILLFTILLHMVESFFVKHLHVFGNVW